MKEKFKLGSIDIYVDENHRFGTDAILLGDFASPRSDMTVCDLCSGCGIIPLYFCKKKPPKKIYGVEIQKSAAELFACSVRENGLEERVFPINEDLTDLEALRAYIPQGSVDVVTANPPYYKANSGKERLSREQRIARHEIACNLEQVIKAADFLLKYGGTVKLCHLPERLPEIFYFMQKYKIQPKKLTLVCNKREEKPWLALVSGKKGGKPGLDVVPCLVMRTESGDFTEEILKMYQ